MIVINTKGDFKNTEKFLNTMSRGKYLHGVLEKYAQQGVDALRAATPIDTGTTANSWSYEIEISNGSATISWINTNENRGVNIALILQYGHGTGTGGYVRGIDYINPAMKPVFDEIAEAVWKEVKSA